MELPQSCQATDMIAVGQFLSPYMTQSLKAGFRKQCAFWWWGCRQFEPWLMMPTSSSLMALEVVIWHPPGQCQMTVMVSWMTSQSSGWSTFCSDFNKETPKVHITAPLCRESMGDWWIPCTKGQQQGKCFHLMRTKFANINNKVKAS